jgi:hypothetical protein
LSRGLCGLAGRMFPALLGIRFQYLCGLCPLSLFLLLVRRLKATRFSDVLKYVLRFDSLWSSFLTSMMAFRRNLFRLLFQKELKSLQQCINYA